MDSRTTTVLGLSGASGGLGTSTLACAVSGLAASLGRRSLLVDLAPNAGGLDHVAGCAHEPGIRWPAREEGMLSLRTGDLPCWRGVRVLSQRGPVLPAPGLGPTAASAVSRLAGDHDVTVLDLPRPDHPHAFLWWRLCSTVVLVTGTTPPQVGAGLVARDLAPPDLLVLRAAQRGGLHPQDVAHVLGLPPVAELPHDATVPVAVLEQEWPGSAEGPVRQAAAALLARVSSGAAGAA